MNFPVLGTLLIGGIAALDATPVAQTLLSQPLVTSTVLGALWGEWQLALEVGVVLQILAASTLPIGARTPEDYALGGVIGTSVALAAAGPHPYQMQREASALVGVFAGMLAATAGVSLIKWQRRRNEGLSRWCEAELRAGHEGALGSAHAAAIALAFAIGVGGTAIGLGIGVPAGRALIANQSIPLSHAWILAQPLWIGYGLAQLLNAFVQRRLARAAAFAAALVGAWLTLMLGSM